MNRPDFIVLPVHQQHLVGLPLKVAGYRFMIQLSDRDPGVVSHHAYTSQQACERAAIRWLRKLGVEI